MLESTAVNAKHSGSGPVSRFTNFSSFAKGDRHEMQGEQTNRHWSGSREWESQPSIPCTERWRRWWYPLSLGWLHEHGMLSHSAHLLTLPKPLLTPSVCEPSCTSAFMVPFLPSANIRLNKIQPAKELHLAVLVSTASPGDVRHCKCAANSFMRGSTSAPGKLSQQVQL